MPKQHKSPRDSLSHQPTKHATMCRMPSEPHNDTIAAIATPPGAGGVGIVRISGPAAADIARDILPQGTHIKVRHADYLPFVDEDNTVIDQGIVLYFEGPHSFTGEDVLELQGHGGPVVMNQILGRTLALGARLARPGEFSERAFLNGKMDLTQVEAIADLIAATTDASARAAQRSLQGEFSDRILALLAELIELRVYVESAIDFPDEEIDFLTEGDVAGRTRVLLKNIQTLIDDSHKGQLLRDGLHIALAGRPNAGKSSLLNALTRRQTAIVTDIPGTTRDVLRESLQLDGIPLHLVDTAGLHETPDAIEQEGIRRARDEFSRVDHILHVIDSSRQDEESGLTFPEGVPVTEVINKIDLASTDASIETSDEGAPTRIHLSAKTGNGMDLLTGHIKRLAGMETVNEGQFMARTRHLTALEAVNDAVERGLQQIETFQAGELLAEELRQAQDALGSITGDFTADDLLGEIFTSFCIGK